MIKFYLNSTNYCPICRNELRVKHDIEFIDYICSRTEDHHLAFRYKIIQDPEDSKQSIDQVNTLRLRLTETGGEEIRIKIYYGKGYSEIYGKSASPTSRVKVNQIIDPDFNNLDALKNKIKTYLLFS